MLTRIKNLANRARSHAGFQRYAINTCWMFSELLLRMVGGLFIGIWVARHLGPNQFGLISYVQALAGIFGSVVNLGLDGILVRELVMHPEKHAIYLGTAFWLKVIGALIVVCLMIGILPFTSNDAKTNLFIFIATAALAFQSFEVIGIYFQSQVQAKVVSICKITQVIISLLIKIYLIMTKSELIWFILVIFFDAMSLAISYSIAYQIKIKNLFYTKFDFKVAKDLLKTSVPLMLGGLSFVIFSNIDSIMIKEIINESAVGIYSAAYRLTIIWYFLPGLLLNSLMPALVRSKTDPLLHQRRKQMVTSLLVWFAIFLAIVTSFFSDVIIQSTYGNAYYESAEILSMLIWVNVIIFFNSCWNQFHIINNQIKYVFYFHLSTLIFNILFNLIFIPFFGLKGAVYAILLSLILSLGIFSILDKSTIPLIFKTLSFGLWNK